MTSFDQSRFEPSMRLMMLQTRHKDIMEQDQNFGFGNLPDAEEFVHRSWGRFTTPLKALQEASQRLLDFTSSGLEEASKIDRNLKALEAMQDLMEGLFDILTAVTAMHRLLQDESTPVRPELRQHNRNWAGNVCELLDSIQIARICKDQDWQYATRCKQAARGIKLMGELCLLGMRQPDNMELRNRKAIELTQHMAACNLLEIS